MTDPGYPDFVKGHIDDIEQALDRIAKALLSYDADFLFGAGMSRSSGVPIGSELAFRLLGYFFPSAGSDPPSRDRLQSLVGEYPFEATVQAIQHSRGTRDALTKVLTEILWSDFEIQQEHSDLRAISSWGGRTCLRRVFTTNFDLLLEKTFGDRGVRITEKNAWEMRKEEAAGKTPIVYLHGQLDGRYYITEEDVFSPEYSILQSEFLNALLGADAFVFVGYSMSDPDFRRIYMTYRTQIANRGGRGKKTYLVCPPSDTYSYRLGRVVWEERGCVWIPFGAQWFFQQLRKYLEESIDRDVRIRIMHKYGIPEHDLAGFDDLVKRTQEVLLIDPVDAIRFLDEARTRLGAPR